MAGRVGLGAASWKRLELEDRAPKGEVLIQLVELGFSADWLLTGAGEMRTEAGARDVAVRLDELNNAIGGEDYPPPGDGRRLLVCELQSYLIRPDVSDNQRLDIDCHLSSLGDENALARLRVHDGELNGYWKVKAAGLYPVPSSPAAAPARIEIDPDLYGRVTEAVSMVFKECGCGATLREIGAEAARITADLSGPDVTTEERPGAIKGAITQLRRRLLSSNDKNGATEGKQTA
jgi:hypothetical protein